MEFVNDFVPYSGSAFLNAGTLSKTPLVALQAMEESRFALEVDPTKSFLETYPLLWKIQERLSAFVRGKPKHFYLRTNISVALNDFIFGLQFRGNEGEILISDLEYGATANMAELKARRLGYTFRRFKVPVYSDVSEEEILSSFRANLTKKTKMVVISHITTGTGLVLPIENLAKEAKKVGAIVLVDGAHSVGALKLDFSRFQDIDFYGGNLHKWFMGPRGTAFGWVNPNSKAIVEWPFGGWASFTPPAFYQNFADGEIETSRRLFPGTIDPIPWIGLEKVFEYWNLKGEEYIRDCLMEKRNLIFRLMCDYGWECLSSSKKEMQSPLITFKVPESWKPHPGFEIAGKIYRELGIQLAIPELNGQKVLRLTAGVYTSDESIRNALRALANFHL